MSRFDWPKVAVWAVVLVACFAVWWGVAELVTS